MPRLSGRSSSPDTPDYNTSDRTDSTAIVEGEPECTCLVLDGVHGVDAPCPLAEQAPAQPTNPEDPDDNPDNESNFPQEAVISRIFKHLPTSQQLIITKATKPTGIGPPVGKPIAPLLQSPASHSVMEPIGLLCDDHPPSYIKGAMRTRAGNIVYMKVSKKADGSGKAVEYVDWTGESCLKDFIWHYDHFNEEELSSKLYEKLLDEANGLRVLNLMATYRYGAETVAWEKQAYEKIKNAGKLDGIATMTSKVTNRKENLRRWAPSDPDMPKGSVELSDNIRKGKDNKVASSLPRGLQSLQLESDKKKVAGGHKETEVIPLQLIDPHSADLTD